MTKTEKNNKRNYTLKLFKNGKLADRYQTHSYRLFVQRLRTINWKEKGIKVYLRVYYGKFLDNFGKLSHFWNDGDYEDKESLWLAFNAFIED